MSKTADARVLTDRHTHTHRHTHTQTDRQTDRTDNMIVAHLRWATIKINNKRLDKQTNRQFANSLSNVKGSEVIDEKGEKQPDRHLKNSF